MLEYSKYILEFTLTHNFFVFKETLNLQLGGTAIEVACAPSYAYLFLALLEREIFLTHPVQHVEKVQLWARYINDVFRDLARD